MVSMIRRNGEVRRAPPGAFGALTNAHHIKIGGPWDSTFEPVFNTADAQMNSVIAWLLTLEATTGVSAQPRQERIRAQVLSNEQNSHLAAAVSSLVARSPRTRASIETTTTHWREQMGIVPAQADEPLIAMNQRGLYDAYYRMTERSGRWAVLFSDADEFIFGDGFLHDFPASTDGLHAPRRAIVPLTPTIAVVYAYPRSYPTEPRLVTLRLEPEEVQFFNMALQGYANEYLFYRSQQPALTGAFTQGGHRQFEYHRHEWLEEFLDDVSQYNLWGPGGAPGRCGNQFLKSFRDSARFEAMLKQAREKRSERS
ncbi:MAG TPA: hypothetical protein VFW39_07640 [Sphingomicrobium sp.]|nr:hypothetical protein [Sphingomicrobium sp.]